MTTSNSTSSLLRELLNMSVCLDSEWTPSVNLKLKDDILAKESQ